MKNLICIICFVLLVAAVPGFSQSSAQKNPVHALNQQITRSATAFLASLTEVQRKETIQAFDSPLRYDWNYTPRSRRGVTLKDMNDPQRKLAMDLIKAVLSAQGFLKAEQIIDLENVLRVVENRPANDSYRDPENYAFLIFGTPGSEVWGWRVEGHHLSLHFSSVKGQIAFLPGFMGSNPAKVPDGIIHEGLQVLKDETELAFELLNSFDAGAMRKVLLSEKAPNDIFSANARKAIPGKAEGLPMSEMNKTQKETFQKLIRIYLGRYQKVLHNQQWSQIEKRGLDKIYFAWMGDTRPEKGSKYYYRIQGPTLLIEYDNTQNHGNHVHSVVRDLENDFGEDLLHQHYKRGHN